jgi:hypothetical protein
VFAEELVGIADTFADSDFCLTRKGMDPSRVNRLTPREALRLAVKGTLSISKEGDAYRRGFVEGAEFVMDVILPDRGPGASLRRDNTIQ